MKTKSEIKSRATEIQQKLTKLLESDPSVLFAYLFGSHARNDAGPLSDVDFAVYLDESFSYEQRFKKRMDLVGSLQGPIRSSPFIDSVVLNDCPLFLRSAA